MLTAGQIFVEETEEMYNLCKHMNKVSSSQAAILVLNWVKTQFFLVGVVKIGNKTKSEGQKPLHANLFIILSISRKDSKFHEVRTNKNV